MTSALIGMRRIAKEDFAWLGERHAALQGIVRTVSGKRLAPRSKERKPSASHPCHPRRELDLPPEPAHVMLGHLHGTALLVRSQDAGIHVAHSEHRMACQDLAPAADSQGFTLHCVVPAVAAASTSESAAAVRRRSQKDPRQAQHKTGPARIDPVRKRTPQFIEGGCANEIGRASCRERV